MSFDPVRAVSRPRYRMENRDQEIAPTDIGIESAVCGSGLLTAMEFATGRSPTDIGYRDFVGAVS